MTRSHTYGGDAELTRLLGEAGISVPVTEIRAIARGVAAAPPAVDPTAWHCLVGETLPEALAAALSALVAEERASGASGLDMKPAPIDRLAALRQEMARRGIQGFLVPLSDAHQSESPPRNAQRLAWLTGFSGSAGMAVVLEDRAAIFVDGRYTLQVRDQVDLNAFSPCHSSEEPPAAWIAANAPKGARIGYDPWLHTVDGLASIRAGCERAGVELAPVEPNPLDAVWRDQPAEPIAPVEVQGEAYSGRTSADKRHEVAKALADSGAGAAVLTAPDSIAWLLNIRGGDLPNTPVTLCFAIAAASGGDGGVELFIDPRKLPPGTIAHLGKDVTVRPIGDFGDALTALGAAKSVVHVSANAAPSWVMDRLETAGAVLMRKPDPCALPKACKNATELAGTRAAHIRDGAALCHFLAWLAAEAPKGAVDELTAVDKLYECRAGGDLFRGLSFETISGAGSNGAIVHYHSAPATNRKLESGTLYLVDSGAQYLDGTTDVTRTVAIGKPSDEMRDRFTRVLKGHIAIATACFPTGTSGGQLDTLARQALWQVGLDFDHGTGHGVGSYLCVHEGPQRIAKRFADTPLRPGMIVSNEPGYYKTGAYGIRIENLEIVRAAPPGEGDERPMLGFEALTLAPIDLALVDTGIMTIQEIDWLNAYHARIRETIGPLVDAQTVSWLYQATRPITLAGTG
ncbi:MAG: aminopeptidase P family protein [Proteobacteria bacterium]|nr:aminopeptidase P family protein [Pseudomonadota bacterium]